VIECKQIKCLYFEFTIDRLTFSEEKLSDLALISTKKHIRIKVYNCIKYEKVLWKSFISNINKMSIKKVFDKQNIQNI
jgi:hypothetical protein